MGDSTARQSTLKQCTLKTHTELVKMDGWTFLPDFYSVGLDGTPESAQPADSLVRLQQPISAIRDSITDSTLSKFWRGKLSTAAPGPKPNYTQLCFHFPRGLNLSRTPSMWPGHLRKSQLKVVVLSQGSRGGEMRSERDTQGFHAALYVYRHVHTCTHDFKASNTRGWQHLAEAREPHLTRGALPDMPIKRPRATGSPRCRDATAKEIFRTHFHLSLFMLLIFLSI